MTSADEQEVRALCQQHGLTEHEVTATIMFLQGKGACPIKNYSPAIRQVVAEVSDNIKARNGELRGNISYTAI